MIVDDTPANLQVLEQILHREGYEVMSFPSGEMALRALKKGKPDLILLDIMMPGISGYDVCRALKADSESASIPVMFLSAMSETEDKIRAFKEGGRLYHEAVPCRGGDSPGGNAHTDAPDESHPSAV